MFNSTKFTGTVLGGIIAAALLLGGCDEGSAGGESSTNGSDRAQTLADERGVRLFGGGGPPRVEDIRPVSGPRSSVENNPPGWPSVEVQPEQLRLGVLDPDEGGRGMVRIYNVGEETLRIESSRASCGCAVSDDLDGTVIAPGDHYEFEMGMNPRGGLGERRERLGIMFEGYETFVDVFVEAEFARSVRMTPPFLTAVGTLSDTVTLHARDDRPFRVLSVHGEAPVFADDGSADTPRTEHELAWDLTERDSAGTVPWFWVVETDHPDAPIIDARIRHMDTRPERPRQRPWVPHDQRFILDRFERGETILVRTGVEYHGGVEIEPESMSATTHSHGLRVELLETETDGQHVYGIFEITIEDATPGLFYESFSFRISNFENEVRLIGLVQE